MGEGELGGSEAATMMSTRCTSLRGISRTCSWVEEPVRQADNENRGATTAYG
jgi:hypothetical protein